MICLAFILKYRPICNVCKYGQMLRHRYMYLRVVFETIATEIKTLEVQNMIDIAHNIIKPTDHETCA